MSKVKQNSAEERALLLDNDGLLEVSYRPYCPASETAITKGVTNHIGKWPSHLFAAFLAASLVVGTFVLLVLVTAFVCIPSSSHRCRREQNLGFAELPNVYFIKHANRTWSPTELCYIESVARDYAETNVYLINLLTETARNGNGFSSARNEKYEKVANTNKDMIELLLLWEQTDNTLDRIIHLSSNVTEETRIRQRLAAFYSNIRNVDVTIDDFFKGSMLAHVYRELDDNTLGIAAKAIVLWNTPGVALDPSDYRYIRDAKGYLCKHDCKIITSATINPRGSFHASGVPCQAFVGNLIREIAKNNSTGNRDVVDQARSSFCKSLNDCTGLEILKNRDSPYLTQSPYCPVIHPSGIPMTKSGT